MSSFMWPWLQRVRGNVCVFFWRVLLCVRGYILQPSFPLSSRCCNCGELTEPEPSLTPAIAHHCCHCVWAHIQYANVCFCCMCVKRGQTDAMSLVDLKLQLLLLWRPHQHPSCFSISIIPDSLTWFIALRLIKLHRPPQDENFTTIKSRSQS